MTEQHVPVERLAAYAAGDIDATDAVEVEAHVALCAGCRSDVDAVRRATGALAGLPPVAMPADVAARVDAAIGQADHATGPVGDVLPMTSRKRSRPSFAGIAAVAACLALVGAVTVPLVTGGGDAEDAASTGRAASAPEGQVETKRVSSGLNYTSKTLATTLAQAAGAAPDVLAYRDNADSVQPNSAPQEAGGATPSAADASSRGAVAGVVGAPPPSALRALEQDAGRLGACIASLAASQPDGLGSTPLLVDFARFGGDPALVVVFPTVSRGAVTRDRVDVWVVGPRCGVTAGDDHVLVFERIARPASL